MEMDVLDRILEEGAYIVETGATVRQTAQIFGIGKTTVHVDVTKRLIAIDKDLYHRVQKVLQKNLKERHIRGGEATKRKYQTENK